LQEPLLLEAFHLTVYAPRGLSAQAYDALQQALDDPLFLASRTNRARVSLLLTLPPFPAARHNPFPHRCPPGRAG
jgi:hypothetical protein